MGCEIQSDNVCKAPESEFLALSVHSLCSGTVLLSCWGSGPGPLSVSWLPTWKEDKTVTIVTELDVSLTPRQKTSDLDGNIVTLSGLWQDPQDLKRKKNTQELHLPLTHAGKRPHFRRVQSGEGWSQVLLSPHLSGAEGSQAVDGDPDDRVPRPREIWDVDTETPTPP